MAMVKTTKGRFILIDDSDVKNICVRKWCTTAKGYVCSRINGKIFYLHRVLMDAKKNEQVDHINGNKLDNRRSNLRIVDNSKNHANIGLLKNNKSGYKGVWFSERNKRQWISNIWCNNKKYHLGSFFNKEDAARAYNEMAIKLFGEYAKLNTIGGING